LKHHGRNEKEWWQTRYVEPDGVAGYLATYRDILTPEISRFELEASLMMPKNCFSDAISVTDPILDGFCGTGRHASEALAMGFRNWTIFDYSGEMLARARNALALHEGRFFLTQQDARALKLPRENFRFYQVLGNSALGFFDDPEDDTCVLREAYRILELGGFFVFDLIDHNYAVNRLTNHTVVSYEQDGTVVRERVATYQNGLLRTGHTEYRLGKDVPITLGSNDIQISCDSNSLRIYTGDRLVLATELSEVDIQAVGRWVYTSDQIMDSMRSAGFEPAISPKKFNYDDTTDKFGTMGVRNLYIGRKT
jgi:SAM-dependent methyltransferase